MRGCVESKCNQLDLFFQDRFYQEPFLPGPFLPGPFLPGPFLPYPGQFRLNCYFFWFRIDGDNVVIIFIRLCGQHKHNDNIHITMQLLQLFSICFVSCELSCGDGRNNLIQIHQQHYINFQSYSHRRCFSNMPNL